MTYWYDMFNEETWQELVNNGGKEDGFNEDAISRVNEMQSGDILICYCRKICTWFNAYEIADKLPTSEKGIFKDYDCPIRIGIREIKFPYLKPENGIPVKETIRKLKFFTGINGNHWGPFMHTFPRKMNVTDGDYLMDELRKLNKRSH